MTALHSEPRRTEGRDVRPPSTRAEPGNGAVARPGNGIGSEPGTVAPSSAGANPLAPREAATARRDPATPEDPDLGATTAEYGIVMLAAVGFAGLLVVILKSGEVRELLMGIVRSALSMG